ncbi:MAG: glycosyltransferase, partial [Colwellia sp.]
MNVAIVLNWKAPVETLACVESVLSFAPSIDHIVLVDNYSCDNSVSAFESWLKLNKTGCVHLVVSKFNSGYAGGNNLGLKYALDNIPEAKNFWILNNDAL